MKTILSVLILSSIVVGSLVASGQSARADAAGDHINTITNPTRTTIRYQVKWGVQGQWRSFSLTPGQSTTLGADGAASAIRFNAGMQAGKIVSKVYNLQQDVGYVFRLSADGRSLDLYPEDVIVVD